MITPRLLLTLLVVVPATTMPLGTAGWSQGRTLPPPPASPPTLYDPDATTCEPERIRNGFQRQLQPYADQSPAVLATLRQVQLDLTERSLRRCVERQLLSPQQAAQLRAELGGSTLRP